MEGVKELAKEREDPLDKVVLCWLLVVGSIEAARSHPGAIPCITCMGSRPPRPVTSGAGRSHVRFIYHIVGPVHMMAAFHSCRSFIMFMSSLLRLPRTREIFALPSHISKVY